MARSPVTNFRWVVPQQICVGARPQTAGEVEWLLDQGVRSVISLQRPPDSVLAALDQSGMRTLYVPVTDYGVPSSPQVETVFRFLDEERRLKRPVFVHCTAGMGRSPCMVALYLVNQGQSPDDALQAVCGVETAEQVEMIRSWCKLP